MHDLAYLVAAAIFAPLMLGWYVWRGQEWPPAERVASPQGRAWYRRAMLLFVLSLNAIVALRIMQRLGLVADFTGMVAGALLGIAFLAAAVPLAWYRLRRAWGAR